MGENRFFPFWDFELGNCKYCLKKRVPVARLPDGDRLCHGCLVELAKELKRVSPTGG